MTGSGGVGAAFGFRYQYLLTVEVLLDLYARGSTDWSVDVDPVSQDSADIVVHLTPCRPPESVLQVKASLPDSSTTIGVKAVQQILDGLRREHPAARRREVITNRTQTTQLAKELANPNSQLLKAGEHFVQRKESSQQLTAKLLHTIGNLRAVGAGGQAASCTTCCCASWSTVSTRPVPALTTKAWFTRTFGRFLRAQIRYCRALLERAPGASAFRSPRGILSSDRNPLAFLKPTCRRARSTRALPG